MIQKKIHYCWFGGNPLSPLALKCIESWKKFFPDYEIIEWNEKNFDVNCCNYVKEAYKEKKWAFVSDYARLKILYEHGGIYFDTDVEVIKSFEKILSKGNFMGCECPNPDDVEQSVVNPGLGFAIEAKQKFIKVLLDDYEKSSFYNSNGSLNLYTIVQRTTKFLRQEGFVNNNKIQNVAGINIYPLEYFCPLDYETKELNITNKTLSIHWFDASWIDKKTKRRVARFKKFKKFIGQNNFERLRRLKHKLMRK